MSGTSTSLIHASPQALTSRSTPTTATASGTPTTKAADIKPTEAKPSPGNFRHPKLTEIIRRQSRSTLTERNIRTASINGLALFLSLALSSYIHKYSTLLLSLTPLSSASDIVSTTLFSVRLLLLVNILLSLRPILPYNKPTTYDDIPLTPSQRTLLGLPPSSTPNTLTPGSSASTNSFITPPRYTRRLSSSSPSPSTQLDFSTDRRSTSANYSSSPLSTSRYTLGFSPSPADPNTTSTYRRTASGSPFANSGNIAGSPLFHKAVHNRDRSNPIPISDLSFDVSSRTSTLGLTGGSPLGRSQSVKERGSSRSPVRRRGDEALDREKTSPVQKGVNYKWLYDKGFGANGRGSINGAANGAGLGRSESMGF